MIRFDNKVSDARDVFVATKAASAAAGSVSLEFRSAVAVATAKRQDLLSAYDALSRE